MEMKGGEMHTYKRFISIPAQSAVGQESDWRLLLVGAT